LNMSDILSTPGWLYNTIYILLYRYTEYTHRIFYSQVLNSAIGFNDWMVLEDSNGHCVVLHCEATLEGLNALLDHRRQALDLLSSHPRMFAGPDLRCQVYLPAIGQTVAAHHGFRLATELSNTFL
jgi:hypothetical protein